MSEQGVSSLALSKVARIIKADPANKLCSKEAIFLISKATEYFIGKLASNAVIGKSIKYDNLSQLITATPYYSYLEPIIPPKLTLAKAQIEKATPPPPAIPSLQDDATPLASLSKTSAKQLKFAPLGGGSLPAPKTRRAKYKKRAGKEEEEDTAEEESEVEGGSEAEVGEDDDGEFRG